MPTSLQEVALRSCHDIINAGHQGTERILDRLEQMTYWVGMAKATELYCRSCNACQQSKLPMPQAVPMTNVPIGRPWQMLAVDVLEVPMSGHGYRYLLVFQDYFTKWAEAVPMPDQTAERIVRALIDIFSCFGIPEILHSDQGRNFESTILKKTCAAFELRDLVECHITQEAQWQKAFYDSTTKSRTFNVGDVVWLHVPTAGKLDTRWEGGWAVKEVLSPVNVAVEHTMTARTRVVHVNRLQQCIVRGEVEAHGEEHDQHGVPVADWEHLALNTSSSRLNMSSKLK
ncbi:hypothetical protein EMCRGX_G017231 [Ephydatia muelleri]